MAGKGGGSWKVAYADFVTAMMAFFLVMWIGAQDVKVRQSVANYFVDPSGVDKKPVKRGAVMNSVAYGQTTDGTETKLTHGREQPPDIEKEPGAMTKTAYNWVNSSGQHTQRWVGQAYVCRQAAARSPEVQKDPDKLNEMAARELAKQLRTEFMEGMPAGTNGAYQDLFFAGVQRVNWDAVAEDLLKMAK